jgi:hypothetical protein
MMMMLLQKSIKKGSELMDTLKGNSRCPDKGNMLAACFLMISCLAYSSPLKIKAVSSWKRG